ncbi:thioesterase family protein [Faecalibacterium cf. prausnitzii KLE1255]|jgi:predicted thioesterase|uniref:Thioesterase family protein n=2 Tax=Faecalibacterium TaxID=216851 RepID=E2ZHD1_9FIRM|nr:thioesterase family protein [Faecalibacterium cf. prausnitzii KLE1255]
MLLVKAFLKIFGICSKLMKFALKRRKFAFLNRNKDADWREGENKKEVAAWSVSSPFPSPSVPPLPKREDLTARLRKKKKRNSQKSAKQGAFWCKMWYLIKVFKNKMRHTARKRRGKYMTLETGIRGEQSVLVTAANTAKTMGSGTLEVFATPALVALAEKTCWMSVADALGEGNGSVGTKLELEHTAPTPVGMTVTCESELVAVEGRKLTFKVALHDEKGPVGGGTHERFVVNDAKFAAKAEAKKG